MTWDDKMAIRYFSLLPLFYLYLISDTFLLYLFYLVERHVSSYYNTFILLLRKPGACPLLCLSACYIIYITAIIPLDWQWIKILPIDGSIEVGPKSENSIRNKEVKGFFWQIIDR